MKWKIDEATTTGVSMTNDNAREYSYEIVKSTKAKDTIMAVAPNFDMAIKTFATIAHDENMEMTGKKSPVSADLVLRKITRSGTQIARMPAGVKIRWDDEASVTVKRVPLGKYSAKYAKRMTARTNGKP